MPGRTDIYLLTDERRELWALFSGLIFHGPPFLPRSSVIKGAKLR